ncbi:hypothetical protein SAMN05444159_4025 [Bradyrhizobium lablabi]|uniref:Uncharacterized protein n=1 Tax=Bradyrhizobium lablabi TaxID=722472 RepID=A0A1M6UTP4_9BRAD|nr:hypothetical protein SAMN05444159_4025 [Bradyrhizobium lablabi]
MEMEDYAYDDKGRGTRFWRKCLPVFTKDDRFVLANCGMSQDEFVRDTDPNSTR